MSILFMPYKCIQLYIYIYIYIQKSYFDYSLCLYICVRLRMYEEFPVCEGSLLQRKNWKKSLQFNFPVFLPIINISNFI